MADAVEVVKLDIPESLLVAASEAMFGKLPASAPEEHQAGAPWPQHVMTEALARWIDFTGVLLDASGFQAPTEPACKPRPRRVGRQEWRAVKDVERRSGIEAVRILRAALHLTTQQPSLVPLLRAVLAVLESSEDPRTVLPAPPLLQPPIDRRPPARGKQPTRSRVEVT
jgi:hypothetical protein